jgi:hypothetical protein
MSDTQAFQKDLTLATYIVKSFQQVFEHARPFGTVLYQRKSFASSTSGAYMSIDPSFAAPSRSWSLEGILTVLGELAQSREGSMAGQ